uniref:Uncharacterized protein n=1 Tax=Timema douglasi TaxID=61478 RepID=A0A7R8VWA9_TIMDO|nr:unnamed protein product [Timema douglasi]
MPKEKSCKSVLSKQWIGGDRNFTTDGKIMFCQPCSKEAVQTLDKEQSVAITEENAAISCPSVSADLAYVKNNFGNLLGAITAVEARDSPLVKAVKIIRGIEENLNQASGSVGTAIVDKFNRVLQWWIVIATSPLPPHSMFSMTEDSAGQCQARPGEPQRIWPSCLVACSSITVPREATS